MIKDRDSLPRWLTHMTVGRRPQYSTMSISLHIGMFEYPHEMTTGFPQSEWSRRRAEAIEVFFFYDLVSEVIHSSYSQYPYTHRHEYQEAVLTGGHLGNYLRKFLVLLSTVFLKGDINCNGLTSVREYREREFSDYHR